MKIGICGGHFLKSYSGKRRYTLNLIKQLNDFGIDVYCIGCNKDEKELAKKIPFPETKNKLLKGILYIKMAKKVNKIGLDIIHCPGEVIPPYFWFIKAKKIITFGGDAIVSKNVKKEDIKELYNRYHLISLLSIFILRWMVSKFIVVSNMMIDNIKKGYLIKKDKIVAIPHGVDDKFFHKIDNKIVNQTLNKFRIYKPYILHVSSFRPLKNTLNIVRAFSLIRKEGYELDLVFIGEKKHQYHEVKQLVNELNLNANIHFLGQINNKLSHFYSGAEALCQPSYRETFGHPILESLACGTPVITSKNIGVLENITSEEDQIRVNPYDINEIKNATIRVISNENFKAHLKKNGLKTASRYSWKESVKKHIDLYSKVLKS